MKDKELWKDIQGYEGIYQVSDFGRIKSLERESKFGVGASTIGRVVRGEVYSYV